MCKVTVTGQYYKGLIQIIQQLYYLDQPQIKSIELLLNDRDIGENISLLDIGCEPGAVAQLIINNEKMKNRILYHGLDQNVDAINFCKKQYADYIFYICDIMNEELPNNKFDVVMINKVVEHLPNYHELIEKCLVIEPKIIILTGFAIDSKLKSDSKN